ncbi:sigma-70 family RNA polymerase sigma factor [Roseovarius phycicola]|uniref:Sigma-70 family RNA polymerase sigma factor n=1 Tax=Roseovarius phycicola TaxID=3080976 RepID=A0ABZ2HLB5_9RHOB
MARKPYMFSGVQTVDAPRARRTTRPTTGRDTQVCDGNKSRGRKGVKTVTQQGNQDGTDWAIVIAKVRDDHDKVAFKALFDHFAPRVKAFLMRSGADPSLAEECTQEVMATLWNKAHLFDPTRASAATWIFTIARNRKIDALRKQKRPEPEDLTWGPEQEPDQADALALQQESEKLGEAIASLPAKQKELIEKAYFGDLSHSEIAAETGLPLGTIKSRIRLALDRLRHAMT